MDQRANKNAEPFNRHYWKTLTFMASSKPPVGGAFTPDQLARGTRYPMADVQAILDIAVAHRLCKQQPSGGFALTPRGRDRVADTIARVGWLEKQ